MKSFINFIMTALFGTWQPHFCQKPFQLNDGTTIEMQFVWRRWRRGEWQFEAMSPERQEDIRIQYAIK